MLGKFQQSLRSVWIREPGHFCRQHLELYKGMEHQTQRKDHKSKAAHQNWRSWVEEEKTDSDVLWCTLMYCDVLCNSSRVELDLAEIAAHYLSGDHNFCPNYSSHQASNWIKYVPICAYWRWVESCHPFVQLIANTRHGIIISSYFCINNNV